MGKLGVRAGLLFRSIKSKFCTCSVKNCGHMQKFQKRDSVGMKRIVKNRWESLSLGGRLDLTKLRRL